MKMECDVIRDLLPLYADDACSDRSRELVKEHLQECEACRDLLGRLRATEVESDLRREKGTVIEDGIRLFRRRFATAGAAVAALVMIPIVLILTKSFLISLATDWIYIVLASLVVLASVTAVPILVKEDKLFWTFCAFTASLMVLLFVVSVYVHGTWFWIASSATLFGMAVAFMPALVHARPVKRLIGGRNKALIVLGVDAVLFINMLNMIRAEGLFTPSVLWFTLLMFVGIGLVVAAIARRRKTKE